MSSQSDPAPFRFGIGLKILLSLSVLIAGYLMTMVMDTIRSYRNEARLEHVSHAQFPAALRGGEALSAFKRQVSEYRDAVVFEQQELLSQAAQSTHAVQQSLRSIQRHSGLPADTQAEVSRILQAHEAFSSQAEEAYGAMLRDMEADHSKQATALLRQKRALLLAFEELSAALRQHLQGELADIPRANATQRQLSLGLFVLVVGATLFLVWLVLNRSVLRPLAKTADLANRMAAGNLSEKVDVKQNDEIGDLARAMNSMAERIEVQMQDLSDSNEALRRSEENLQITLDSIGEAVLATDEGGHILRMNPAAEKLSGWSCAEAKGRTVGEIFNLTEVDGQPISEDPVVRLLRSGQAGHVLDRTRFKDRAGRERLLADSGAPIRNGDGTVVGAVLVFRDITEQQQLQDQLQQTQKMESIGRLAGGVAHDFNNMLGGIMGSAELLRHRLPKDDERLTRLIELIITAADQAGMLTDQLLAFSRKSNIASTPIDVHEAAVGAIAILERTIDKRVTIEQDLAAPNSVIVGDPSQIQNAILNLGVNARDAMPEGGTIRLSTENVELGEAFCTNSRFDIQSGSYVQVSVRDTGCGMPPELLEQIFEPFFTTKEPGQGTGLGLAAVYGTVDNHQGAVSVYSEPGKGTVFHLYLPVLTEGRQEAQDRSLAPAAAVRGSGTILVVDDELVIRTTASQILQELGYDVLLASDGEEAVARYADHADEISLVLLDVIMPKMNGRECFRAIRTIDPDARVLISSGFAQDATLREMRKEGTVGFVKKPYREVELSQAVDRALRR